MADLCGNKTTSMARQGGFGIHRTMARSVKRRIPHRENSNPIGVFDSGVGGLTVAKKIFQLLPHEKVIYFGDTGRYPYGPRSQQIVRRLSSQNVNFLLGQRVKFIVVACNTASAVALPHLQRHYDVPMAGVIEPGARAAVKATRNGRIGVIGTVGTISSGAYPKAIHHEAPGVEVLSIACPLFVALAEEGYINRKATRLIATEYLSFLVRKKVDTLVLGCTHYPLLKGIISQVMGKRVKLIDSAEATAVEVKNLLKAHGLLGDSGARASRKFYVSDVPDRFIQVGERFLKSRISNVSRIDIDRY
jgi:glutamate racemase